MRPLRPALAALALLAGPATAQIAPIPETSRSEAQTNAMSNSLVREGRARDAAQQNQFEINSLRNESSRIIVAPPVAPPIASPAPPPIR